MSILLRYGLPRPRLLLLQSTCTSLLLTVEKNEAASNFSNPTSRKIKPRPITQSLLTLKGRSSLTKDLAATPVNAHARL